MKINTAAIIVAAGRGERFGAPDKAFTTIAGQPMVSWSLDALNQSGHIREIVLVAGPHTRHLADQLRESNRWPALRSVVQGGDRRQDSVLRGLRAIEADCDVVVIHDAARPLVETTDIDRCIAAAAAEGGAIVAIAVADTIKRSDDGATIAGTVPREGLWAAQTPQAFTLPALETAFARCERDGWTVTDDASMVERAGGQVAIVPGSARNIKVTTPEDAKLAETLLLARHSSPAANLTVVRTGIGYDVHRFASNRKLILGGLEIPSERGLDGHSDADVLSHAITDALLGAAALGDIGTHFPPTDDRWRNASSLIFLEHAAKLVRDNEGAILNIDATIVAEAPKLMPFAEEMRARIAAAAGVPVVDVSVKATTNEGMGFIGREEGIAAFAIATIAVPAR